MTWGGRQTLLGFLGLLGAILVGAGEYTLQFNTLGDYASAGYEYFSGISQGRLTGGHFLSVLAAPLYLLGYWHLASNLAPASKRWAQVFFFLGAYSFIVGAVWMGQRVFLAETVQAIDAGLPLAFLLERFAALNEPFVNVLRLAVLINSVIWISLIVRGRSNYPRWLAAFSPIALLAGIFALYFVAPEPGRYLLPGAMNVVHVIIFSLSLLTARAKAQ